MEIEFLGTGAGVPAKHRNVTGIALKLLEERNEVWLFDCGEGTQMQILHTTIRPRKVNKIFITHLHGDHLFGLPGFVSSRSFQGGDQPLDIYGPKGVKDFLQTALKVSGSKLAYPIYYHELQAGGTILEEGNFTVKAEILNHGILSFGYRIEEKDHPGELLVEKLQTLKIPSGPLYGKLKKGEDVTLNDGTTLFSKDFIGQKRAGRIVAIFGDTRPVATADKLAKNADVLVHESTFMAGEEKMANNYFHSTNVQAAALAKRNEVGQLLLTHLSARYLAKDIQIMEEQAKKVFPNTKVMKDFDQILIPLKERSDSFDKS